MQKLGQCLSQAIGESLGHDRVVVVVLGFKAANQLICPVPCSDRKSAQIIGQTSGARRDIVGETTETRLAFTLPLLPQAVETLQFLRARFVGEEDDVSALRVSGIEAVQSIR